MKFRIAHGKYFTGDPEVEYIAGVPGRNVIESDVDLVKRYGNKFEYLEVTPGLNETERRDGESKDDFQKRMKQLAADATRLAEDSNTDDPYDSMSEDELRKSADSLGVNHADLRTRRQIIARLRSAVPVA